MLTKCFYKFDGGVLKSLNLRMCKLTEQVGKHWICVFDEVMPLFMLPLQCLELLAPVVPHLTSAVLSSNNFSGAAALKVSFNQTGSF